jgi:uncharacterized cupredoxin-like copper-binding protein
MRFVASRPGKLLILAFLCAGAGFTVHSGGAASPSATHIRVVERDFRITAPKQVAAGDAILTVVNKGPDDHELVVVRANGHRLPLRSDAVTVSEEKLTPVTTLAVEPGARGSVRTYRLHLRPGYYVLFCNMAGHFMAGMHTTLRVR